VCISVFYCLVAMPLSLGVQIIIIGTQHCPVPIEVRLYS
jgi:hypothetical protein